MPMTTMDGAAPVQYLDEAGYARMGEQRLVDSSGFADDHEQNLVGVARR